MTAMPPEELAWSLLFERPGPAGYLKVITRSYRMPDQTVSDWDILVGARTVAVVALTSEQDVVLVRQFRPGPGRVLAELPGGVVGDEEDVLAAAARELVEETGYVAGTMRLVGQTWLAGYATHQRFAVLAEGCSPQQSRQLDVEEFCQTQLVGLAEFRRHVRGGDLTDTDIAYLCLDALSDRPS